MRCSKCDRAAGEVLPRDSPQLAVKERHHAVERLFVPISPGGDQSADVRWTLSGHAADPTTKNSALVTLFPSRSRNTGRRRPR